MKDIKIPRLTMIKGSLGCFERVDAFTHKHIEWVSDEEIEKIKKEHGRELARFDAEGGGAKPCKEK